MELSRLDFHRKIPSIFRYNSGYEQEEAIGSKETREETGEKNFAPEQITMQRFFGSFDLSQKSQRISDRKILHQLKDVLRLGVGDKIILSDEKSNQATAEIVKLTKDFVDLALRDVRHNDAEPEIGITLYCAILKRENFEWVVQKTTEVGVREIVPVITKRTVKLGLNVERLQKIAKEAAEQAGRGIVPVVYKPMSFADAAEKAKAHGRNMFCDVGGDDILHIQLARVDSLGIWIGPEGGWGSEEVLAAQKERFMFANLGKLVLRAETAAIIASYFIVQRYS